MVERGTLIPDLAVRLSHQALRRLLPLFRRASLRWQRRR
jgi:hypothetical protein